MLWKLALTLLAFLKPDSPPGYGVDNGEFAYKPKSYEPQTPREAAIAKKAIERPHKGGDMRLPIKYLVGNVWNHTENRWPGYPGRGIVPYVIDKSIKSKHMLDLIKRAMEQYEKLTCVKFIRRKKEKDYIRIFDGKDDGCWSYVGRVGTGVQDLSLGVGCEYIGTIVHELGHAIGFLHEHQRHDRDTYITVHENNIGHGLDDQFDKTLEEDEIIVSAFNYNSIMIYGKYAFSKKDNVLPTITAKNGVRLTEPYNKPGLDKYDIVRVKVMYKCMK